MIPRRVTWIAAGVLLTVAAAWGSLCLGAIGVGPLDAVRAVADAPSGQGETSRAYTVVMMIRLPRIVAAACVGASLGTAGCMMQALLRNPLASPFVIGTSSAASFGAVIGIFLGLSHVFTLAAAFATAALGGFLVLSLARVNGRLPTESVILTGFGVGLLFSAGTGFLQYIAREESQLREMVLWLLGGLWRTTWQPLAIHVPVTAAALVLAMTFARDLDVLSLGETDAHRLGVRVARSRTLVLVVACLLTSLAVALAGVVAFVGLVVPHVARRLVGVSHRTLLPACAVGGALFLVVADTVARTAMIPHELPLGIVTSMVGAPAFLAILRATRRRESFL